MQAKKIEILLSAYNGEKYLAEQLRSIMEQDYPHLCVRVRDDGSRDGTVAILDEFSKKMNLTWYAGPNLGTGNSFLDLLAHADGEADYYAFCDQDDVWLPNKVSEAVKSLSEWEEPAVPCVYGCRSTIVDEKLRPLPMNRKKHPLVPSFGNALAQCILQGCGTVMNGAMRDTILAHMPREAILHDWWFYLVATGIGRIRIDPRSFILYRQHDANVMGRKTFWSQFRKHIRIYQKFGRRHAVYGQMAEFSRFYGQELTPDDRRLLMLFLGSRTSLMDRLRIFFGQRMGRIGFKDDLIWKTACLLGML